VTYAVMELLEGHSLRDALAGSGVVPFPVVRLARRRFRSCGYWR
jgi:hypothetical protein